MLINQLESTKLIKAPVPGLFFWKSVNILNNSLFLMVTVNDYHTDSIGFMQNGFGLPNLPGNLSAIFYHTLKLLASSVPSNYAGFVQEPTDDASVIDPFWMQQRSFSPIWTVFSTPFCLQTSFFTVYEPFFSSISTSVTSHPNCGLTPLSQSQTCSGLMSDSYWFIGVRMTPSNVSILQNSCMNLCMQRLSSKAEFQTWNPNVVCHISQKWVLKKSGVNQSVILVPWSSFSEANVSLSSYIRWL